MTNPSRRAASVSDSITMAITAKAREMRAAGEPVIGFGAGEPDFPTPDFIVAAASKASQDPVNHHYGPAAGNAALRQAIVEKTRRDSLIDVSSGNVVVTNGAKQAVYTAMAVTLDPGDEVLIPSPYWVTYPEAVKLNDGVPVFVAPDDDLKVSVEALERAASDRTRLLLLTSPSNPTGVVYTPAEIQEIGEWAAARDVLVMTDEIYEHLVYGDAVFSSVAAQVPEIFDRCLIVNGVSKTYAMTGWRVGWLIAPDRLAKAASRFQSHVSSNVANVSQIAALAALEGGLEPVQQMKEIFDRRRRKIITMLRDIPGVELVAPEGAFYAFPGVQSIMEAKKLHSTVDLAQALLEEAKVAVVPGDGFGAPGFLRFSFALAESDLEEGLTRFGDWAAQPR